MTTDAARSSFFIALVVVDVFVGLADALCGPYLVLFWLARRASAAGLALVYMVEAGSDCSRDC